MISVLKQCVRIVNCFPNLIHYGGGVSLTRGSFLMPFIKVKFPGGLHTIVRSSSSANDYNFNYFRSDAAYKSSVVQLHEDINKCVVSGTEFEYYFEGDVKAEALFRYLRLRENVMKLSNSQVKELMCFVANLNIECDSTVLRWLDEKCAVCVMKWPLDLTLYVLDAWYLILGHKTFKKYYFPAVLNALSRRMKGLTKNHVIQVLYFVGLSKFPPPFLMSCLESKLEKLRSEISDVEWAIACISFFKTSTKFKSEPVLAKSCEVAKNFMKTDERFHLTSVLKSLRQAQYYDKELIQMLESYIADNYEEFNFVECSNFLAFFAAQNIYCSDVFNLIEKHCVNLIFEDMKLLDITEITPTTHPAVHFRVKDLARLLWAMVAVGHCPEAVTLEAVLSCIRQRLDRGEYRKQPQVLVDTLHSLAIVECYPQELLSRVLCSRFLEQLWNVGLDKPNYQFYFLYKSAEVESPESIVDKTVHRKVSRLLSPIPKSIKKQKSERAGFQELTSLLKAHLNGPKNIECCNVLPHFVIAGFRVTNSADVESGFLSSQRERSEENVSDGLESSEPTGKNHKIVDSMKNKVECSCIEILDETVCVKDTIQPMGLMKAKVRQLHKLSYNVVEITPSKISELASLPSPEALKKIKSLVN